MEKKPLRYRRRKKVFFEAASICSRDDANLHLCERKTEVKITVLEKGRAEETYGKMMTSSTLPTMPLNQIEIKRMEKRKERRHLGKVDSAHKTRKLCCLKPVYRKKERTKNAPQRKQRCCAFIEGKREVIHRASFRLRKNRNVDIISKITQIRREARDKRSQTSQPNLAVREGLAVQHQLTRPTRHRRLHIGRGEVGKRTNIGGRGQAIPLQTHLPQKKSETKNQGRSKNSAPSKKKRGRESESQERKPKHSCKKTACISRRCLQRKDGKKRPTTRKTPYQPLKKGNSREITTLPLPKKKNCHKQMPRRQNEACSSSQSQRREEKRFGPRPSRGKKKNNG